MLGSTYAFIGEPVQAEPPLREAVALLEQSGRPWALPQPLFQLASVVGRLNGGLDEAATLMHRALALLAEWPDPEVNLGRTSLMLAQNRARAGDLAAASRHFTTAAARFDRDGHAVDAAGARASLGQMLAAADRYADAAAVLESLIEEEAEPRLPPEQRAQARLDLGRSLMAQEEPRAAAGVFGWLADFVTDWPDRSVTTMTACELGIALFAAEMPSEGEIAVRRALAAHAQSPDPVDVCRLLRVAAEAAYRGRGANGGGRRGDGAAGDGSGGGGGSGDGADGEGESVSGVEAALAYLRQADEVNESAREFEDETGRYRRWPESALNADQRAKALAEAERYEEALTAAEQSGAAWEEGGPQTLDRVAEAVRIAGVIEGYRLGRVKEAVERVTPTLERCRAAGRERAVNTLTQLVEDLKQQM
jgi:tetratricopeptide (TPR) repeat protein